MYALLAGMSDALGIERNDIDGVIRPVSLGGVPVQEIVLYDSVPGGAGYVQRLLDEQDFLAVLKAAYQRVANCQCGADASCYRCLREYRNQYYHDALQRGPVAEYLGVLLPEIDVDPDVDKLYPTADASRLLHRLLVESPFLSLVSEELTDKGPAEMGPWTLNLAKLALQIHGELRLALIKVPSATPDRVQEISPFISLLSAGARIYSVREKSPKPRYALFAEQGRGGAIALKWSEDVIIPLDSETHRRPILINTGKELPGIKSELDKWFAKYAKPISIADVLKSGMKMTMVQAGKQINYMDIFGSAVKPGYRQIIVQDPYLITERQMTVFEKVLRVLDKAAQGTRVSSRTPGAWPAGAR